MTTDTENKGVAERSMGFGLRALNRLAGSDLLDRIRIRKQVERAALPGHQERLPLGDRRRPHLQGRPAAGQTGAPDDGQVEGPLRPHPRRRAADVPGGGPRLRRGEGPPGRAARPTPSATTPPELLAQATELGVNMLGVPEELGGVMQRAVGGDQRAGRRGARPRRHGHRRTPRSPPAPSPPRSASGAAPSRRRPTCPPSPARTSPPRRWRSSSRGRCSTRSQLETTARRDGDGLGARRRQVAASPARDRVRALRRRRRGRGHGPALFLVESGADGLSIEAEPAMGLRAAATGRLAARGRAACRPSALLGEGERRGLRRVRAAARGSPGARSRSAPRRRCSTTSSPTSTSARRSASRSANRQAVAFMVADIGIELEGDAAGHLPRRQPRRPGQGLRPRGGAGPPALRREGHADRLRRRAAARRPRLRQGAPGRALVPRPARSGRHGGRPARLRR